MLKDLTICVLASLNLLIFSFIGLNGEAFAKMMTYEKSSHETMISFEESVSRIQEHLASRKEMNELEPITYNLQPKTYLLIPSLNIISPIQDVGREEAFGNALQQGVVRWNNILFGHSSDYPWNSNPYGTIFTLLPKIKKGDHITLLRGKEKLQYLVTDTAITDPQLKGLVSKISDKNKLILSTCYPIGFSSQRFNVVATPL